LLPGLAWAVDATGRRGAIVDNLLPQLHFPCQRGDCMQVAAGEPRWAMRALEASLQQFGEFLLTGWLVREKTAPHCVRWVRRFLTRPASDEPLADQARRFCEELERNGGCPDWQVRQAEQALRIYFVNFLQRTDWHRRPASTVVGRQGQTNPLVALDELRRRLRSRHYAIAQSAATRTGCGASSPTWPNGSARRIRASRLGRFETS